MKVLSLSLLLLLSHFVSAQGPRYQWAKSFAGNSGSMPDVAKSVAVDDSGNVYTCGNFRNTVDFNPGPGVFNLSSAGSQDIFIQKLDASGNFLWARSLGGNLFDGGSAIALDAFGNVYTAGFFNDTADFDPGAGTSILYSVGMADIFIQKMDASGNFIWARSFGGSRGDFVNSIAIDDSANIYSTGTFENTVDFDPGPGNTSLSSLGRADVFVHKIDSSGNFQRVRSFGGTSNAVGVAIELDDSVNIYTIGYFEDTVDFDPDTGAINLSSVGATDMFIHKLDPLGDFLWARSIGGTNFDFGFSVAVDSIGNVYSTGTFRDTVDFDPGTGTFNLIPTGSIFNFDCYIQKLDAAGNFLWARSYGGSSSDQVFSIILDDSANVYTTGNFQGIADFDPGSGTFNLSATFQSAFIQKLDSAGQFVWARSFGSNLRGASGNSITTDELGNLYTTGTFRGTVDFDPGSGIANLTSSAGGSIFLQKLSQCIPDSATDVITACNSLNWIDGNTYTANNNTATFTLTNAGGCDSVVTLNLIINTVTDVTTTLSGTTITANNTNASYQWLDCNNGFSPLLGDTNQSFTATANGSYAVEFRENGCVDTSQCVAITTVGIDENSFAEAISIYPNPTDGNFSIDLGSTLKEVNIRITDMSGRLIRSETYQNTKNIDLQIEESAGMYLLNVESEGRRAVIHLRKE